MENCANTSTVRPVRQWMLLNCAARLATPLISQSNGSKKEKNGMQTSSGMAAGGVSRSRFSHQKPLFFGRKTGILTETQDLRTSRHCRKGAVVAT
jgi:hypothetical protein